MLVEPDLDRGVLAAALNREYGLAAGAVRFIPVGETAWYYQVTDERGRRWFLKLSRPGAVEPGRAEFVLKVRGVLLSTPLTISRTRLRSTASLVTTCIWSERLLLTVSAIDGVPRRLPCWLRRRSASWL